MIDLLKEHLKYFFLFLFIVGILSSTQSLNAQQKGDNFGIGVMLGEPSGLTIKKWLSDNSAFDIGAAWSLSDKTEALHLHSDFLFHSWFEDNPNLAFYYGIGVRTILDSNAKLGVRIPFGLNYVFENIPFDAFVEAVPIVDIAPDTRLAGNGAVGLRFYF
ncbi:MAG: hypothetical protein RLN83_14100 [Balneola sp.]